MPFEDLTVCGKNQVRKVVKRFNATHLISLVDPEDRASRPQRIAPTNHLSVCFDDVELPELQFAPTEEHIVRLLEWVDGIPDSSRLVVHCTAGISRSTAIAYGLLCRESDVHSARDRLLEIREAASPNALVTSLLDKILGMDGALHSAALEIRKRDPNRPLPEMWS